MSVRESIVRRLGGTTDAEVAAQIARLSKAHAAAAAESHTQMLIDVDTRVKEAIASLPGIAGRDPDDWKFRRLSATPTRELNPCSQDRMIELAYYLWLTNPLAKSLLGITRDFVVGKGFQVHSQDPDVDRVLTRWWNDGANRMELELPQMVLQLGMFGEQFYPAFTSESYGRVRLGYIDPAQVEEVLPDPDNVKVLFGLVTRSLEGRPQRRYRIILNEDEDQIVGPAAQRERDRMTDGECFYFSINRLSNMTRGKSDLLTLFDWLDGYEQFLFENLDRLGNHLMTFVWDITFKGLTEEQIEKKMAAMRPPRRGSVRGHNENVAWAAVAPDLKSYETGEAMQNFKRHIIGTGARMPLTWFGDPEDANRASAGEMNDPPVVMLSERQRYVVHAVREMARHQLRMARAKGTLTKDLVQLVTADGKPQGDPIPLADAVTVTAPEISTKDTAKIATALGQLSTSLMTAEQQGWLSKRKAAELYAAVATQLGPGIDLETEVLDERVTVDYREPRGPQGSRGMAPQ